MKGRTLAEGRAVLKGQNILGVAVRASHRSPSTRVGEGHGLDARWV